MRTISIWVGFVALVALSTLGCRTTDVPPSISPHPTVVYVADFELGAQTIGHEEGLLTSRPGPVGRVSGRLTGAERDPSARARQLVELMATSLVKELTEAGLTATRVPPGAPPASHGWLLRGLFTEVEEGNRLRRAMIGMGRGQTDLQVVGTILDLSQGTPQPLYEIAADAHSGTRPGAAPTLILGPYGAAARFVLAGHDLEKNVREAAALIAGRLAEHIRTAP